MLNKITGIILAGGQSSRMNGEDKGLIEINGQSLCQNLYKQLQSQVNEIIISCNQNMPRYQMISPQCQSDIFKGSLGPLAGIHACLKQISTDYFMVVPCDLHDIPCDLVTQLFKKLEKEKVDLCYVSNDNNHYYLIMLGKKNLLADLEQQLSDKQLRVRDFIKGTKHCELIIYKEEFVFSNINSRAELEILLKRH